MTTVVWVNAEVPGLASAVALGAFAALMHAGRRGRGLFRAQRVGEAYAPA